MKDWIKYLKKSEYLIQKHQPKIPENHLISRGKIQTTNIQREFNTTIIMHSTLFSQWYSYIDVHVQCINPQNKASIIGFGSHFTNSQMTYLHLNIRQLKKRLELPGRIRSHNMHIYIFKRFLLYDSQDLCYSKIL